MDIHWIMYTVGAVITGIGFIIALIVTRHDDISFLEHLMRIGASIVLTACWPLAWLLMWIAAIACLCFPAPKLKTDEAVPLYAFSENGEWWQIIRCPKCRNEHCVKIYLGKEDCSGHVHKS